MGRATRPSRWLKYLNPGQRASGGGRRGHGLNPGGSPKATSTHPAGQVPCRTLSPLAGHVRVQLEGVPADDDLVQPGDGGNRLFQPPLPTQHHEQITSEITSMVRVMAAVLLNRAPLVAAPVSSRCLIACRKSRGGTYRHGEPSWAGVGYNQGYNQRRRGCQGEFRVDPDSDATCGSQWAGTTKEIGVVRRSHWATKKRHKSLWRLSKSRL